jgi:hypothetical protein
MGPEASSQDPPNIVHTLTTQSNKRERSDWEQWGRSCRKHAQKQAGLRNRKSLGLGTKNSRIPLQQKKKE